MQRTLKAGKRKRKTTYRTPKIKDLRLPISGGDVPSVIKLIDDTAAAGYDIRMVNPASKFVVATYWWGKANLNRNLQRPCPEDITDPIKEEMEEELAETDATWAAIYARIGAANRARKAAELTQAMTPALKKEVNEAGAAAREYLKPYWTKQEAKDELNKRYSAKVAELTAAGTFQPARGFPQMIEEFNAKCAAAGCNHVAVNIEFPREDYQNAINGKAHFIKTVLDDLVKKGRPDMGVLYIDGDMWINKYPMIFDMPNIDYMARGWNIDPRASPKYKNEISYDPYVFETSGGTMFFGNTEYSRILLSQWATAMADPINKGKAEDRVISMILTKTKFSRDANVIQLPIEYLWLTDIYTRFQEEESPDAFATDALIEHPACLTGEERAADQGAAESRQPVGYEVILNSFMSNPVETMFYEHIYFPSAEMAESFRPYLNYLGTLTVKKTKNADFKQVCIVVPYAEKYGMFNVVAEANKVAAAAVMVGDGSLPQTATVPEILAHLARGIDVSLGERPTKVPMIEAEFIGRSLKNSPKFHVKIVVDVKSPMFFSAKNPILQHLLIMCETLEDINKHLDKSYVFVSRIRWSLDTPQTEYKEKKALSERVGLPFVEPMGIIPSVGERVYEPVGPRSSPPPFLEPKLVVPADDVSVGAQAGPSVILQSRPAFIPPPGAFPGAVGALPPAPAFTGQLGVRPAYLDKSVPPAPAPRASLAKPPFKGGENESLDV